MIVKRQRTVMIDAAHILFPWADTVSKLGNNLKNASRFRQRQILTAKKKDKDSLTENEKSVINEVVEFMGINPLESNCPVSKSFLYGLLYKSHNPDLFAEGLPRQSAEAMVFQCVDDMNNYWKSLKEWSAHPEKYLEKPKLPGYARKGGRSTVTITNQDCTISMDKNGISWAAFPFVKKIPLCIGAPEGTFKEAKVVPFNGAYKICFVFDVEIPDAELPQTSQRIASIDFGVDNLMAVTNNIGAPCLLFKGGIVKSCNRFYNKRLAGIIDKEMRKPDCPLNKDGKRKFIPTPESKALTVERDNRIKDFMRKAACFLLKWCVEHRIDTIVAGVNPLWKQKVNLGHVNNQNFVQIPFSYLRAVIKYKAEAAGILYVEQEESYTSKASFIDQDPIPVYKEGDNTKYTFSGKRGPHWYKGMHSKNGFRGLYQSKDGTIINSDLNGSANILRKAFPEAFKHGVMPDFTNVVIIKNPERVSVIRNQEKQMSNKAQQPSKSKLARLKKKASKAA